jgi:putative inorganic carbon (HCO3(-)) transporter
MNKEKILTVADKAQEYSLYAIILFIPFSIALVEAFVIAALLGFIVKKIISPDFTFIKRRIHFLLLLFYIFCGLSLLNSGIFIGKSFHAFFIKWGQFILIFFMVQDALSCGERIRNAMRIFLFVGGVVAIDGIVQHFCGWEFLQMKTMLMYEGIKAITGPFRHYNGFAAYLICILNLFMAVILGKLDSRACPQASVGVRGNDKKGDPLKNKVIYCGMFLSLFMLLGCLLLTSSRGGWVGFLFAGFLMLFLTRQWKFMLTLVCFSALMAILIPAIRERAAFIFASGGDAGRFAIWKGAWGMIKAHPFLGNGIGTFMQKFPQFTKGLGVVYAHNCYLQIWAETGIFALVSFISFVLLLLWQGIMSFRKSRDYIALGLLCAISAFLVHSFFDTQLYSLLLVVLFWFLAGMLAAVTKNPLKE